MKLLFDEGLSPRLVQMLGELFPESESALRNGLAGAGDRRILEHAAKHGFVLVTTDRDFVRLMAEFPQSRVAILQRCDYPTAQAADAIRRNAVRLAALGESNRLLWIAPPE